MLEPQGLLTLTPWPMAQSKKESELWPERAFEITRSLAAVASLAPARRLLAREALCQGREGVHAHLSASVCPPGCPPSRAARHPPFTRTVPLASVG